MLVNKTPRAPDDLTQVRVDEEWEVHFWCAKLDVSPDELRAMVAEVGPRAEDIEKQLHEAGRKSFRMGGED